MKTNKLKLNDLKVNSFVTALNDKKAQTVQGGRSLPNGTGCPQVTVGSTCPGYCETAQPCFNTIYPQCQ